MSPRRIFNAFHAPKIILLIFLTFRQNIFSLIHNIFGREICYLAVLCKLCEFYFKLVFRGDFGDEAVFVEENLIINAVLFERVFAVLWSIFAFAVHLAVERRKRVFNQARKAFFGQVSLVRGAD